MYADIIVYDVCVCVRVCVPVHHAARFHSVDDDHLLVPMIC